MRFLRVTVALLAISVSGAGPLASGQVPARAPADASRSAAEPYKKRGDSLARQGQLDLAAREYRTALTIDGSYAEAHNELGQVYAAQGKLSMAMTAYRLALTQLADFPQARYNLAYALRKSSRFGEAATEYRRFVRSTPTDPDGHYGLGETLKTLGDKAGARAAYERYLELEKRPEEAQWIARAKVEVAAFEKDGVVANPAALAVQNLTAPTEPVAPVTAAPAALAMPVATPLTAAPAALAMPVATPLAVAPAAVAMPVATPLTVAAAALAMPVATPVVTAPIVAAPIVAAPVVTAPAALALPVTAPLSATPAALAMPVATPVSVAPAALAMRVATPVVTAPIVTAPAALAMPVVAAPVVAAPVVTAPVVTAPVVAAPVVTAPVVTAPVVTAPVVAVPVVAVPVVTAPVVTAPVVAVPVVAVPIVTAPIVTAPVVTATKIPAATGPGFALSGPAVSVALADTQGKATDAAALLAQGEAAFRLRQFPLARERLEAAAKAAPARADLHYKLAAARVATGDLRAALASWEAVLALEPKNEAAQDYAMRAREKLGLFTPTATETPPQVQVKDAGSAPVARAHALGRAFAKSGDRALLVAQGEALMAVGRYAQALRALLEAAALRSGDALPYYQLAVCHRRLGDTNQSAYFARLYLRVVNAAEAGAPARIRVAARWAQAAQ